MKLYHGTITPFDKIDVKQGKGYKDFGRGFYLSADKKHAAAIANRDRRHNMNVRGYVYVYDFDICDFADLSVLQFDSADADWLGFICKNRQVADAANKYDLVIGPTADDSTNATLNAFMSGLYGDPDSPEAVRQAVAVLQPLKLAVQYYFRTQRAAKRLEKTERRVLYI